MSVSVSGPAGRSRHGRRLFRAQRGQGNARRASAEGALVRDKTDVDEQYDHYAELITRANAVAGR